MVRTKRLFQKCKRIKTLRQSMPVNIMQEYLLHWIPVSKMAAAMEILRAAKYCLILIFQDQEPQKEWCRLNSKEYLQFHLPQQECKRLDQRRWGSCLVAKWHSLEDRKYINTSYIQIASLIILLIENSIKLWRLYGIIILVASILILTLQLQRCNHQSWCTASWSIQPNSRNNLLEGW